MVDLLEVELSGRNWVSGEVLLKGTVSKAAPCHTLPPGCSASGRPSSIRTEHSLEILRPKAKTNLKVVYCRNVFHIREY